MTAFHGTGVGCKLAGAWLIITSAILVYGETAPLVLEPNFTATLLCLGAGIILFYVGCLCCTRSQSKAEDRLSG